MSRWSVRKGFARRELAMLTACAVVAGVLVALGTGQAAAAVDATAARARVLVAWQVSGPEVRAAAEHALLGTDADIAAFLDPVWAQRQETDERLSLSRMLAAGGPTVRNAGQQALNSTDLDAVGKFLTVGWESASVLDQRIRVNQMLAAGGPLLRAAGQKALAAGPGAVDAFIESGWTRPHELDQRIRVSQILNAGGPDVKKLAQRALEAGTLDAYADFIESGWAVAATRDQETRTISDLVGAAIAASEQAVQQTQIAKDQSAKAVAAAEAARKAAENAAAAADRAHGNALEAAAAARQAADAADSAAKAAREAISAARAASEAAKVAASAAARAAAAAAMTEKAATKAHLAAAGAATDANKAAAARDAAAVAREVAVGAQKAADAARAAGDAAREAGNAARAAGAAGAQALTALAAVEEAARHAAETGVNTEQAIAAANRARASANRANQAAIASATFADLAALAADRSHAAAMRAVADAYAAADAADQAAVHAGESALAASRSTEAANAATAAANESVAAVQQAREVYDAARTADAARITVDLAEGRQAAQAANEALQRYAQKVKAESQEATKRSAEVNALITLVANPATVRSEAVTAARKVALALTQSQGPWTRRTATDALGGSDDMVLAFVRTGINAAAAQDDRVMVASLAASASQAMTRAAETALAGSDADVAHFLLTQDYPERLMEDRIAVNQVLSAAQAIGDPLLAQRAQSVLSNGTGPVMRQFLSVDQFTVAAIGDRVRASQILADNANGPELKASAQIALDNTPAALRAFLDEGQYTARQHDLDTATHEAEMLGLLAQAAAAANTATQQAQEAQSVAATARGSAAEAAQWALQAQNSANTAAGYANQAVASSDQAQQSADRAAASAKTAAEAAARANTSANQAARSAAWAQDSYQRAAGFVNDAVNDANAARESAIQAGEAADAANREYELAFDAAIVKAEEERQAENARQDLICRAENLPGTEEYNNCRYHVTDSDSVKFGKAMLNAELCSTFSSPGSIYEKNCLYDSFNPNFGVNRQIDILTAYVAELLGIAVVLGGVTAAFLLAVACNALCGTVLGMLGGAEATMGIGGLYDMWLTEQLANAAAGITGGMKAFAGLRGLAGIRLPAIFQRLTVENQSGKALLSRLALRLERCIVPNSFTAQTRVLLANGASKPISDIRVGETVLATDPATGTTDPEPVTETITGTGDKQLIDITVDAAGTTSTITATDNHPFWVADLAQWTNAGQLQPGTWLRTSSGTWVQVAAVARRAEHTTVYNLGVAHVNTFYALAGNTPLLVHNQGPCDVALGYRREGLAKWADDLGYQHYVGKDYADPLNIEWMGPVQNAISNPLVTLHVRLDGFSGGTSPRASFLDMAMTGAGLRQKAEGTQLEMAWIARALYRNEREWSSVKFYKGGQEVDLGSEPDWWNLIDEPILVYPGDRPSQDVYLTKEMWRRFLAPLE